MESSNPTGRPNHCGWVPKPACGITSAHVFSYHPGVFSYSILVGTIESGGRKSKRLQHLSVYFRFIGNVSPMTIHSVELARSVFHEELGDSVTVKSACDDLSRKCAPVGIGL